MAAEVTLRAPSTHTYSVKPATDLGKPDLQGPTYDWLSGPWNVSYSSLPLWKGKQNVRIIYGRSGPRPDTLDRIPDLTDHVEYQKEGKEKISHIHGISRPVEVEGLPHGLAYNWRGKGWLKIASSDWEILGFGTDSHNGEENDWIVTFFSKTIFTPAGADIYTRSQKSLSDATLDKIKTTLAGLSDDKFTAIAESIFEIPRTI